MAAVAVGLTKPKHLLQVVLVAVGQALVNQVVLSTQLLGQQTLVRAVAVTPTLSRG
jgi:hypothetical protein